MGNRGNRKLVLENEKVRTEKYYSVGYDKENERYVLVVVITWVAWYNRYYSISREEYDFYETEIEKLDSLADDCYNAGILHERFICSEAERDYNSNFSIRI